MATTYTGRYTAGLSWVLTKVNDFGNTIQSNSFSYAKSIASGTGADQANMIYIAQGSIAASGTLTLDLAGSLADVFGATITFTKIKGVYFDLLTTPAAASSVDFGGAGSNTWVGFFGDASDVLTIRGGSNFSTYCPDATGYAVTAGTGDQLLLTNNDGANAAHYKLAIVGVV